jgi:hypothetical protein
MGPMAESTPKTMKSNALRPIGSVWMTPRNPNNPNKIRMIVTPDEIPSNMYRGTFDP